MTENLEEQLFVKSKVGQSTLECALVWRGLPVSSNPPIPPVRFRWTEIAVSVLKRIRRMAQDTRRPEGKELPYADLRASIQARVSGMILLESWILPTKDDDPFFAAIGSPTEVKVAAHRAVSVWAQLTLREWVEKLGIDCGDVDFFEQKALKGELLEQITSPPMPFEGSVPDALQYEFHQLSDALLAIAASALDGTELFPGLGPVHRVIERDYGNAISFETWPSTLPGSSDMFSMVAQVSVATRPSSSLPFLVVKASKKIWCSELPTANQLFGRRRISIRVAMRSPVTRAVTLSARLDKGLPAVKLDPLIYEAGRTTGESFDDLAALVKSRGRLPDLFVGVPFRYGYRPVPELPTGVTLQDQVDLTRTVSEHLAVFGFEPSRLRILNSATNRPTEFHSQATLFNLINHHFGRVPEEDVPARIEELFGAPEKKPRGRPRPVKTVDLEPLLAANQERLDKAFGAGVRIDLGFVCRREAEETIFRSVVGLLFGDRVNVVRYAMPDGVHGLRKDLDGEAKMSRVQRAAARRDAWAALAGQMRDLSPGSPVIVQAARTYEGRDEDVLNKEVGRNSLATIARCSVQYLLPPDHGKAAEYMHRVQAALYDLLFGHAGLGPVPAPLVKTAFPAESRPRLIVGISVVSQASSRTGRPEGATLAAAMKIEIATGRISGRIGFVRNGILDAGKFEQLSTTLVDVASAGVTSLGDKLPERRKNFLSFLRSIVNEIATEDPHALILVESTTTRSFWKWLSDENISSELYLDDPAVRPPSSWKGLRFVRVREGSAGRLAVESHRQWIPVTRDGRRRPESPVDDVYATAIERLVESMAEGNARARHYLTAHGFNVRNRGARGQSVYRSKPGFRKADAHSTKGKAEFSDRVLSKPGEITPWDAPSRIPVTLEVTVIPSQLGDDEDAVATLVSALRNGYSHTADETFLPAPLSFRSKILDYMDRYGTGAEFDDPDADLTDGDDDDALAAPSSDRYEPVGYAETKRWFEGAGDVEDDVPDFDEEFSAHRVESDSDPVRSETDLEQPPNPSAPIPAPLPSSDIAMTQPTVNASLEPSTPNIDESQQIDTFITTLRSPSAPLPSFVTEEFLANAIHVVNSDTRHMHEDRDWIRNVTGFPWPEERPAVQEMPAIYREALRYPAFAVVFQHQFFPDDRRGLPKNQIITKNHELWRRLRTQKPLAKGETHLSVLWALHASENGGDNDAQLAETLGLPGHAAWNTKCSEAAEGLNRLEAREGPWGELGRYLRAVVGPFQLFGNAQTIGEVIEQVVIPYAMRQSPAQSPNISELVRDEANSTAGVETSAEGTTVHPNNFDEVGLAWTRQIDALDTLAKEGRQTGPMDDSVLSRLQDVFAALGALHERAVQLAPAKQPTSELRDALRLLATKAADALTSLTGDAANAPDIFTRLFEVATEAETEQLQRAAGLQAEAEEAIKSSDVLGAEIVRLETTLPLLQARQQTTVLYEDRAEALRRALDRIGLALDSLPLVEPAVKVAPLEEPRPAGPTHQEAIPELVAGTPVALESELDPVLEQDIQDTVIEAPPEEEIADLALAASPSKALPESDQADPLRDEIITRLDGLFSIGEHGLAFHLRNCASAVLQATDDIYTATELRLAATTGRALGLSGQDLETLSSVRSDALALAQSLGEQTDDRSIARLTLLLSGSIAAALFRPEDGAAVPLVGSIAKLGPFERFRKLVSVVEENRKLGFPITVANLLAVEAHSRDDKFISESVEAIKEAISSFRSTRFRFHVGDRLRNALMTPQALLGRLLTELTEADQTVAREAAERLRSRAEILRLLDETLSGLSGGHEIDGQSRERAFAVLSRVGQQCADLVRSIDGLSALRRSPNRLEAVQRMRDDALAGIDEAMLPQSGGGALTRASVQQSEAILAPLRDMLAGRRPFDRDAPPLAVGLHTPLLWLPNMTWTGGWTPSPYNPDRLLQEIMGVNTPLVGADPAASITEAFEHRRTESAFVPAYMLLNIAHWYGIGSAVTDALRSKLDADKEAKKNQVAMRLRDTERTIERMRRMAVGSLEQSARLKETLSTIHPRNLPVELPPTFLPETIAGDRVEDFNSAFARIREVETEAQREFEKATNEYANEISQLDHEGKLDPQTGAELRSLLTRREFTTLADWLNMIRADGIRKPALPTGPLNGRLARFKSLLPQLTSLDVLQVARAIDGGRGFGPLDYGHLEQEQRTQAANIARTLLPALKRHIKASAGPQIGETLANIVSQLLFEVGKCEIDQVLTRIRQQVYAFDAKVSLPSLDPYSLLLPEFGSVTQGSWRICVVTSTVSHQGLLELADGAGPRGVLVLYLGVLNSERRAQLRLDLFKRRRAMLVVDEALIAVALADKDDHRRAIMEIGQGYSGADPYKDYGRSAVPPEMFKGRSWERQEIVKPVGSFIVFGGRRLGKTALLQQIHATPPANAEFAYVDVDSVVDASDAFERISSRVTIFPRAVRNGEEFTSAIMAWLAADERRRMLLLIDEVDNFLLNEAGTGFRCIRTLLQLMADSKNRFKFVLAGLHNVSRLARTENSPLVHISNDPLQIGPLLDQDVDDAELLVRGPLAAMGFEFEKREDVWRILSFTNYYPVLIQLFCEELLRIIHVRAQQTSRLPDQITTSLVEDALRSSDVRTKLFATFEKTIVSIEGRYELLTYILAARELLERDSGMAAEGMTSAEVAERAVDYWPAAFPPGSDPIEIEYLLEEMEGFGIARRTVTGGFALRSRSVLELMASDEADLTRKLESYRQKEAPPKVFDPKNFRRTLGKPLPGVDSSGHVSPLTDGQESDLIAPFAPAVNTTPVATTAAPRSRGIGVVFGTPCAGIHYVESALKDSSRVKDGLVEIELRTYEAKKDLIEDARRASKTGQPRVLVVSLDTPWRPDWVVEAERVGRIRKGEVRVVFLGGPEHATAWSSDITVLKRVMPQIKTVRLRPVTRSYLGARLESLQLSGDLVARIIKATGGWSETVGPLLSRISERPAQASSLIDADAESLPASSALFERLGIPPELEKFFRELAQYADGSTITFKDFQYLCSSDGRSISPSVLAVYSDLLGIISFSPDHSGNRSLRKVDLNPLVHAALLRSE
ncbi:RNaseH domain-containing protein [Bradyrhizobium australafricanum]|uniref:RNaseH domain-containing protein n=1 Tax=Bradyrhizobium australafricanum TaxID=2821406 RepID=UPI001CE2776C|nr:RNaseH domain-containing protein [Bradyrhizobium australafricanum]MCA6101601.1 DUF3893 domain-containing protein [Bradyrhizobium australafricanum]